MSEAPTAGPSPALGSRLRVRVGLIVNPIAGLGGRVGLHGSDGPRLAERAAALGARPEASQKASQALRALVSSWPRRSVPPLFIVAPGPMGEEAGREAGLPPAAPDADDQDQHGVGFVVVAGVLPARTSGEDTSRIAARLAAHHVDLLLFAGGDGTARDVQVAIGDGPPVLGIPAGVKIQSSVFATSPTAAGRVAAAWLSSARRRTVEREVLDLDEDAYRRGDVRPILFGYLRVPQDARVQARKAPTPPDDAASMRGIAESVVHGLDQRVRWILGPGTTVRAIADRLGVAKTLVGIDVVEWTSGGPSLVAQDVGERQLLALAAAGPLRIIVTPIGGQGFLFGRGNQPISSAVIWAAVAADCGSDRGGLERALRHAITVVSTPGKLASLGGRPLLVDTGDRRLDAALAGPTTVITGYRDRAVVVIAAA